MTGSLAPRSEVGAVILCGGRSRRFGGDKALARLGGVTLLDRVITGAGAVASEVVLAAGATARYEELAFPVVRDEITGRGPLAGIAAGLHHLATPVFVLAAVDLPLVTAAAFEALLAALPGHDLVMPRGPAGWEPLLAAGRREACLAAARDLLAGGEGAPHLLPTRVRTRALAIEPPLDRALLNVNTPEDLARAEALVAPLS